MDENVQGLGPEERQADLHLCIFPHLKEFVVSDLRPGKAGFVLLNSGEVLRGDFYDMVEQEFADALRERAELPFIHLINLPLRVEEMVRGVAMNFILLRLGINPESEDIPTVVVFIISGGALATHSQQLVEGLRQLLGEKLAPNQLKEWEATMARLMEEENAMLRRTSQHELSEAVSGETLDYFTLWESRN
ncbi:MAG: hypothetical protein FJ316_05730 [SAR202 cluster bacterium]|nr:hypothetical protein [SAR202 cluster bacterium]